MKRVVIIGGGIAGLSTAYFLLKKSKAAGQPLDITLLEATPSLGGKITTSREGNFIIEGGPDSFISIKPEAIALCEELGLSDELVGTDLARKRTYILLKNKLHGIPDGMESLAPKRLLPFLLTGLLSPAAKMRVISEAFVPAKKGDTDESVADFIERRMGPEFYKRIAEPLLAGIYAGDARTLSLMATMPRLADMEKNHGSLMRAVLTSKSAPKSDGGWTLFVTLKGGLSRLTERLQNVLEAEGVKIKRGTPVALVRKNQSSAGGYSIVVEGPGLNADAVVMAIPAFEAARLIRGLDGRLAGELESLHYNPAATVSLAYKKAKFPHKLNGYGFVVPRAEGKALLACTWTSSKYPGRTPEDHVLIRGYLGGNRKELWQKLTDEQLAFLVREDLGGIMGIWQDPELTRVYRWEKAMPQYGVGHLKWVQSVTSQLRPHPGLYLTGSAYRGVGIPDCIKDAAATADLLLPHRQPARA